MSRRLYVATRRAILGAPCADERHELSPLAAATVPQLLVGDLLDGDPGLGIVGPSEPLRSEVPVERRAHRRPDPGRNVDAVGHVSDRDVLNRPIRP
jgi:hypothetical protein